MYKIFLPIIAIAIFIAGFWLTQDYLESYYSSLPVNSSIPATIINNVGCDEDCRKLISQEVQKAIASTSASPKTQVIYQTQENHQTQFISLGTGGSTTNTEWEDVAGTDVSFDLANDYAKSASVSFSASLKVADSNGQALVRLFDVTHGTAVDGSEISTTDNSDYKTATSGNLNLWSGKNTYRVQIKSLNSFIVSYTGGKIRISY